MFANLATCIDSQRTQYRICQDDKLLTFDDVLTLWANDTEFRRFYTKQLAGSQFPAFRWETPALTTQSVQQTFEWVLINAPSFATRPSDSSTFSDQFTDDDVDAGVIAFSNLRGDATMIVPSPRTHETAYGHLAAFLRGAPESQTDALWQVISREIRGRIGTTPIWLSTAGGGVAWLHVRIDSRPKYYGHTPYKRP